MGGTENSWSFLYIYNYIYICSFLGGNTGKSYVYTHIYIYIHALIFRYFFPRFGTRRNSGNMAYLVPKDVSVTVTIGLETS